MADRIDDLLQRRAALVTEQRRLLDTAEGEDRSLNAEETQSYERMGSDLSDLETRIERLRDARERQRSLAAAEQGAGAGGFDPRHASGEGNGETDERMRAYNEAFESYVRRGMQELTPEEIRALRAGYAADETRDLSVGVSAQGGYTVPTGFYGRLVEFLTEAAAMRQAGATILETGTGNDIPVPKVAAHGTAAWVDEAALIPTSDETFEQANLEAWKAARRVLVSLELLEDSAFDIEGYIARELGRSIGELEGTAYLVGDGTKKPEGLFPNATVGVTLTTGHTTDFGTDADAFLDLIYSVPKPYRRGASFVMGDASVKVVRKLKGTDGQYVWQDSARDGEPDRLFGYPVQTDPNVPAAAADAVTVAFGQMAGYWIRDVKTVRIFRLGERYMENGQVGFIGWHRTDGALVEPDGIRTLKQSAT